MKSPARNSRPPAPSGPAAAAAVDGDLVARAYQKVLAHQELSRAEREALKRHERQKEEELRWRFYRSIPQKHWRAMSGRQTKVLQEQAARYGLPFGGSTVNLPDVVKALHDFLAANAAKLAREDDPLLQGGSSPALERYREERATIARLDRLERERKLLPRDEVKESLGRLAAILRGAGDTLQRHFGAAAAEVLHDALEDAEREIARSFDKDQTRDDGLPDPT